MSTWKEQAEAEIRRQEAVGAAEQQRKLDEEAARRLKEKEAADLARVEASDFTRLGISQKLSGINKEILNGHGKTADRFTGVGTDFEVTGASLTYAGISEGDVKELEEVKYKQKYGRYTKCIDPGGFHGESGYYTPSTYRKRFGRHEACAGRVTTGVKVSEHRVAPLCVDYEIDPKSGDAEVVITDFLDGFGFKEPDPSSTHGAKIDISKGEREVTLMTNDYKTQLKKASIVRISVHHSEFDPDKISSVVDKMLAQSVAARLPHVERWDRDRKEAERKISEIKARIGKPRS